MRKLISNNRGSAIPLILFFLTIFVCGALYTFLFLEFALPQFSSWIPDGDAKVFIMMGIYSIPLFIIVVGIIALLISGLKRNYMDMGGPPV